MKESTVLPDECIILLIKYLDVKDVLTKLLPLNKHVYALVAEQNYLLFKHFLREFNLLNDRMKRTDIPAKTSVMSLLRENV